MHAMQTALAESDAKMEAAEEEGGTVKAGEKDEETHKWPTSQPAVQLSPRPTSQAMLKEFFGDHFKIAEAYMKEALDWPTIKPEDGVSLQSLALFLTGCSNTMTDIGYMEDLDNTANIRALATKLPYKLKES